MDNNTAKLILSAYRSGGEDTMDPFFGEALEQARLDPELADWLAEQRSLDETYKRVLQSERVPHYLRDSLLAGNRISPRAGKHGSFFQRRSTFVMAAAAMVALLLTLGFMVVPGPAYTITGDQLVQEVFDLKSSGQISLGKLGGTTGEFRDWLAAEEAPHDFMIPAPLIELGGMGCQVFEIQGHKVSLVCFMLDQDRVVHFFVIDSDRVVNAPGVDPEFVKAGGLVAATWSANGKMYVLTGADVDEAILRKLI